MLSLIFPKISALSGTHQSGTEHIDCISGLIKGTLAQWATLIRDFNEIKLHALWSLRVWSLRASTGSLKKIRVYQYPFLQSQYSHFFSYAL